MASAARRSRDYEVEPVDAPHGRRGRSSNAMRSEEEMRSKQEDLEIEIENLTGVVRFFPQSHCH